MPTNLEKLRAKLAELFQLDQADLDFGIYRIMNSKREEILRFLDEDLLPQVQSALSKYKDSGASSLAAELTALEGRLKNDGVEPSQSKKYQELAAKLEEARKGGLRDAGSLEQEVFSDLYNFFSRYYDEGDFLSLRRYKAGVYAVPYEGEEVYLHWANKDQYYIKTSEYLRDYAFKLSDGRRVHFKLVEATTETENKKEQAGQERRFVLDVDEPMEEVGGELLIRFHYKSSAGEKKKQSELNTKAVQTVLGSKKYSAWTTALSRLEPTASNPNRTLLEKHLLSYTARNTFDYFIHKDLGRFLRRELDFFIKNEVMHLDDIESDTAPRVEQYLSKIKALRAIAGKVIEFLEQLERFQKRLWLKKKFIVETHYCVTLDRVPAILYADIAKNVAQREEWVRLFGIDQIASTLHEPGYSTPLSVEFLKAHPSLSIDTSLFDKAFVDRLLASAPDIDALAGSTLIGSDNFHALRLLAGRWSHRIDAVYIDPPYNTAASEIAYKNDYKHSSWMAFLDDRLEVMRSLLKPSGFLCVTIDDFEVHRLRHLLEASFGSENLLAVAAIRNNPQGRSTLTGVRITHEYALFFGASQEATSLGRLERSEDLLARYDERDEKGEAFAWDNFRKTGTDSQRADRPKQYFPLFLKGNAIRVPEMEWDAESEEWRVLEKPKSGEKELWPLDDSGTPRVWKWGVERTLENLAHFRLDNADGNPQIKFRHYVDMSGRLPSTWWDEARYAAGSHGTNLLTSMFGTGRVFSFPKSLYAVVDCLKVCRADPSAMVLDFFGGSGTTAHAVLELNDSDKGNRRYTLVESAEYFDGVLRDRVRKAVYCPTWRDGKPVTSGKGRSHGFKYVRVESYEDALLNVSLSRSDEQVGLLASNASVREDYTLRYMLDIEARHSLLKIEQFSDPYAYTLKVHRNGETQEVAVDLVETFNWLLGLTVRSISIIRNVRVVEGTDPEGQKVLVLWRKTVGKDAVDNDALNKWFEKSQYSTKDREFDFIYVNGDNHLENIRTSPEHAEATWKVRLIEQEFQRLMFEGAE
ncbi:MAG: DNA methyltransferase [Phycisphaerales bacterium]